MQGLPIGSHDPVPGAGNTVRFLLRRFRVRAGLSQEALGEKASISARAISALERGVRQHPHAQTLRALSTALRLAPAERYALLEAATRSVREPGPGLNTPLVAGSPSVRLRLPEPSTPLIGRDAEVDAVVAMLQQRGSPMRLVTLVGPGGVGKTRLALAVAHAVASAYADGIVFVDLAALRDQHLLPATIAHALEVHESEGRSAFELLIEHLGERHILLVLDNFEQLLDAAPQLAVLLRSCANLALLVTSRTALRLRAERRFTVSPLAIPAAGADCTLQTIASSPAVRLFVERAQTFASDFTLTQDNAAAVAAVCRRLDGIPLALELAGARVALLRPEALLQRLERRLPLLTRGAADLPERQQTLRNTLGWSHDLLGPAEQTLFRRLAVFAGGWTLEAAEAVCRASDFSANEVLERLGALVDNSLVQRSIGADSQTPRFSMLETVREFAAERLVIGGDDGVVRDEHAACYLGWLAGRETALRGEQPAEVLRSVEREIDNIRAAWSWAVARGQQGLVSSGLDAFGLFYELRGRFQEAEAAIAQAIERFAPPRGTEEAASEQLLLGRVLGWQGRFLYSLTGYKQVVVDALERAVALLRPFPTARRALVASLYDLARCLGGLGQYEAAAPLYREALALAREVGDHVDIGYSLDGMAGLAFDTGDYAAADVHWRASLSERRQSGDATLAAYALSNVGEVALKVGKYAEGRRASEESFALLQASGGGWRIIHPLTNLGTLARIEGRHQEAWDLLQRCLGILRETGDRKRYAEMLVHLARVSLERGDPGTADQLLAESRAIFEDVLHPRGLALCGIGLAQLAMHKGDAAAASREAGVALTLARAAGLRHEIGAARAILGQAALLAGDRAAAVQHLADGFEVLAATGARPEVLDVAVMVAGGPIGDVIARVELLASALAQPALSHTTRIRAEALLPTMAADLPAESLAAARARGAAKPLETAVAAVLTGKDAAAPPPTSTPPP